MLNVIFQTSKAKDPSKVIVDSRFFFSKNKKKEWFADPFVQSIINFVYCLKYLKKLGVNFLDFVNAENFS